MSKARINKKAPQYFKKVVAKYSQLNKEMFLQELEKANLGQIVEDYPIDEAATIFSEQVLKAAKLCMPFKTIKTTVNSPPWLNNDILLMREEKKRIHSIAKRNTSPENWQKFRDIRNQYSNLIRTCKSNYTKDLDERISKNDNFGTKDFWKLVNNFMKSKGTLNDEIPPIEDNNKIIYNNVEKAKCFNNYFQSQSTITGDNDPLPPLTPTDHVMTNPTLTLQEVTTTVMSLDTSKAVGPDNIHNIILKSGCSVIAKPLTSLFNKSLSEGIYPSIWKIAHVTPIHKKGSKSLCANYRPISLLSCVGKILEKCIKKHLTTFLNENNIISNSQSGFTQGDSTIYQLLSMYDDFSIAMDNNITTQAIFFDISKAFDKVWHRGLLHKLNSIGIRGNLLTWFNDYLSNRKQAVVLNGSRSEFLHVRAGVPQGSVLGPILFLIYINDITSEVTSTIKLFADDTSIYRSLVHDQLRFILLNSDLIKISQWAVKWKVAFNPDKTELLNLKRTQANINERLSFEDTFLDPVEHHKHLGLTIQENCKWNKHIDNIVIRCRTLTSCLKSYKYRLSRKSLEIMYKSFILPLFDYADVIWDNCTQAQTDILEDIQLDALRTISGTVRGTSHEQIYNETGFITLKERRSRHKLVLFYKFANGLLPDHITERFPKLVSETNPYHRRRPLERVVPFSRTELHKHSFFPSATSLWNSLADNIKQLSSIGAFKHFLKKFDPIPPARYYIGQRIPQIIHCRLRLKMSDLNYDLFNRHLSDTMNCTCGHFREDALHYLLYCRRHQAQRNLTINQLPPLAQNSHTLLYGNNDFSDAFNKYIFLTVHDFIENSKRFTRNE